MPLQIGDLFRILKRRQPKALYVATIGLTTGFAPDQRQRVMQLVIRDAQAPHDPGGAGLRALQAAAGGGAAIIRLLAKAVIAEAGNWWRTYTIRRARIAAVRELHALDDRTLSARRSSGWWSTAEMRRGFIGLTVAKQPHVEFRRKAAPHTKG